jgi:DNA-binding transcriptional LysR family regulator
MHGIALRYFLEVARTGSISGASERLHVAISAISRQITKLEDSVGVALFERRPRGMVLSDAGQVLAAYARRTILEADRVLSEIGNQDALTHSMVRIASPEGFSLAFLPMAIASFRECYPGVRFRLQVGSPIEATQRVRDGDTDLALTLSLTPEKNVKVEHSERSPIYALMSADHPLATRSEVTLSDLIPYQLSLQEEGTTNRQLFDICSGAEGLEFEPVFVSNNIAALYLFSKQSGAIMLTGHVAAYHLIASGEFVAVPINNPVFSQRTLQIQSMAGRTLPTAVGLFRDHLIARLRDMKPLRP